MIRVKLLTEQEWLDASCLNKKSAIRNAEMHLKHHMLDTAYADVPKIPFRDPESLQYLKETYDISFVSDEDWYSVMCDGSRSDITCLRRGVLWGLAVIDISKQGLYSWFFPAEEPIWKAFSNMPFDVLIARRMSEIGIHSLGIEGTDYLIENYPYRDQAIEVIVKDRPFYRDTFYVSVPEYREHNTSHMLCRGGDGKYYTYRTDMKYAFQYYWRNDIEGIIHKIERIRKDRATLMNTRTFDVFELGEQLSQNRDAIMDLDYLYCVDSLKPEHREGKCEGCSEDFTPEECYAEYLYFRDKFRIISHIAFEPDIWLRKIPLMIVDKNTDGTYFIHGTLTVKNPSFSEIIYDIINMRSQKKESFVLVVHVPELMENVHDIEKAVCGFRVLADSVEIYDGYEGTQLFGEALKEAYYSGRCTVDTGFC